MTKNERKILAVLADHYNSDTPYLPYRSTESTRGGKMIDECYVWCPKCGVRLTEAEIKGWGCPKCGTQSVPCSPTEDVWIEVNWHELRILTIWAENWARHIECKSEENKESVQTVAAIAARIQHQWPKLAPLTLSSEIAELPEKLRECGLEVEATQSNIPRPERVQVLGPGAVGFSKMPEKTP